MTRQSELLTEWLGAVNQPVVNSVEFELESILDLVSDNGNFTCEQCKKILGEVLAAQGEDKSFVK